MREAVGVLGGTFDPVHVGHLRLASEARACLHLARTLFVPAAHPPHKSDRELTPASVRVAMLERALRGVDGVEISFVELRRPGVGYTIDTLRLLRDVDPRVSPVFLLGMDSLATIETWRDWRSLLEEFDLAVFARSEATAAGWTAEVARRVVPLDPDGAVGSHRPGAGGRIFRLPTPPIAVSSSDVRRRVRAGLAIDELVPAGVARYIQRAGLYRNRPEENH